MTSVAPAEGDEYILQAGDVIDIKFFYNPDLNERLSIRPDGRISLQLIDEVYVAGLSPAELDKILTERYSKTVVKPEITVIVKEFAGQEIYVGGEVMVPKAISLNGNMTALQAIVQAGGFRETANLGNVVRISKGPNNSPVALKINLTKVVSGESAERDIFLRPFDILYVPKSPIANVNKFVDQYINKIVPDFINVGFGYTRYRGKVENIPVQ
jgi:protein involved in polysaccharide export with SLBB domain